MPRQLALFLTCAFVFYLFRRDVKEKPNISGALWIPLIWFLIVGSRPVTVWLSLAGIPVPGGSLEDGNPVERLVSMVLIAAGCYVLFKRGTSVLEFIRNNVWLTIYLAFCFVAISWSDYAFVSFKRWTRALGEPVMALVVLTELDRVEALTRLIKRATYVLAPFSIMTIKYFPEIGRAFSMWGGGQTRGISGDKNALGRVCLILGLFLFWHLLRTLKREKTLARRNELALTGVLLWMVWYNLIEAASSTALMGLVIGMLTVIALGRPWVNRRFVGAYVVAAVVAFVAIDAAFGAFEALLAVLGEDPTLTGRTDLWKDLLGMGTNPILGVGYESFWLGDRLAQLWSRHWWQPNEAHNGYLETYLNLGLAGLFIVVAFLLAVYRKGRAELLRDVEQGRLRLGFLAAFVLFNWTEAGFRPMGTMLLFLYVIAIDYPVVESIGLSHSVQMARESLGRRWMPALAPDVNPSAASSPFAGRRRVAPAVKVRRFSDATSSRRARGRR
jgi:O-antigen ligase